jgi:phage terminase small subunit
MMRIAAEFGFTPASRSRIATPQQDEATLFDVLEQEDASPEKT